MALIPPQIQRAILAASFAFVYVLIGYVLFRIFSYLRYEFFHNPLRKLPQPSFFGLWRQIYQLFQARRTGSVYLFKSELHKKYGPIVRLGPNMVAVYDAVIAREILSVRDFPKTSLYQLLNVGLPPNIFTTNDKAFHKKRRRFLSPAFGIKYLSTNIEPFVQSVYHTVSRTIRRDVPSSSTSSSPAATVDIWDLVHRYSIDVIGETAFGTNFGMIENGDNPIVKYQEEIMRYMAATLPVAFVRKLTFLPFVRKEKMREEFLLKYFDQLIEERRSGQVVRNDILQMLIMESDPETGEKLTNEEIQSETGIFFFAGSETTANTICFTIIQLLHNPDCLTRLLSELDAAPLDPNTGLISNTTAKSLPYLNACIKETLRLDPIAAVGFPRVVNVDDFEMHGYQIPKGTIVMPSLFNLHHDKKWGDPQQFKPDRFILTSNSVMGSDNDEDEGLVEKAMDHYFIPFSMGSRNCIGKNFAWMEMRVFLANFFREFEVEMTPGQDTTKGAFVTLQLLKGSYKVAVRPRKAKAL
ncbi:hypothetical protein HK102_010541 [Quaeritorhiza haematococci]|nr:hypothetical protein HK102_010541 [Quaeritorhiza haematococci]